MVAISAPDSIWAAIPTPTSGTLRRRIDLLVPCPEGDAPIMTALLSAVDPRRMARWPIDFDEAYEYFPQALNDSMELGSPAEFRRVGNRLLAAEHTCMAAGELRERGRPHTELLMGAQVMNWLGWSTGHDVPGGQVALGLLVAPDWVSSIFGPALEIISTRSTRPAHPGSDRRTP
ncbi:hypothetical protein GCM10009527_073460 [Actinomadura nitritigenes]|uniref:Transcriptional regulator n=1 Tax=Actinomadura nitritigenes TaxID=134602 RepID=A0ABS3RGZ2_9ACTN|nr:hypothetical protein [Actinomadura nitritigenes]MBO2444879.1 hypothetical protein [Actinomadura nitritigenes]